MARNISEKDLKQALTVFNSFDANHNGSIEPNELKLALEQLGIYKNQDQINQLITEVDADHSGTVEFEELLTIWDKVRKDNNKGFASVVSKQKELIQIKGAASGGVHSFSPEEMSAFACHLNNCLQHDPELDYLLPIDPNSNDLCRKVKDGVLLCKFINLAVPDTIDERALNKKKDKINVFQTNENQNLCISAAKSIGVSTVNLGATELSNGEEHPHLVLGIVWQLVKIQLLNSINLQNHPELYRLLEDGEELADLLKLPAEQLLLRWFNYHLKNANHPRRVHNFAGDVKDSENYTVLLNQICPSKCDKSALGTNDLNQRAGMVLANSAKLDVASFIQPSDIVAGNARLNLAYTAAIFNTCPGLDPLGDDEKLDLAGLMDDDVGDSREERAFRMWINSLGLEDTYINNLFEDCRDGLVLLRIMDFLQPGIVAWNKVEMRPNNKFKKVSNTNYVVVLGKQMRFSMVNIGGTDLTEGNKKLTLGLVWQMMRMHTIKFLSELQVGGKSVDDTAIIKWANSKVAQSGKQSVMRDFKDKTLSNSIFFFDLLNSVKPLVDWDLVTQDDELLNAKYAISIARKMGCTIFLLPEDIVEVKDKMIMTFVAAIMAIALQH